MGYKILIADDDTNICDLLKIYLENEGYETVTAYDGIKALSAFKIYEPDLVLLDIMMPRKDGWQVCREIREMSSKPIIMVTAKGEVFDKLKLAGKPVDIPPKELELLYFLTSNYNRVFTRDQLLDKVWGFDYLGDSRTVDVHVKRLREKLDGVSDKWTIKTVWGVGYKFELLQQ